MLEDLTPQQVKTIEYGHKNPYSILSMAPGMGKSRCGLETWKHEKKRTLIICPGSLVLNWKVQIKRWLPFENPIVTYFQKGTELYKVWDSDIVVISPVLVQKAAYLFEWADIVIADEAHNFKNMEAQRTEFFHKEVFENSIKKLHLYTGTPIKNRVCEYFSLISLCNYNPKITEPEFLKKFPDQIVFSDHFSHRQQYTMQINGKWVKIVKWEGLRNIPELRHWLKDIYVRFESDRKEPLYKEYWISDKDDPDLWDAFQKHFGQEGKSGVNPANKKEAAMKKVPFTVKYVKDHVLDEAECVAIFSDHIDSCEAIADAFGVPAVTGKVSTKVRHTLNMDFQAGKFNVFCATVGAFKEGRDLTRAHNLVYNDYPWVSGDIRQVNDRINRMGQKAEQCVVHKVFGSPQDEKIWETLKEKAKNIALIT